MDSCGGNFDTPDQTLSLFLIFSYRRKRVRISPGCALAVVKDIVSTNFGKTKILLKVVTSEKIEGGLE